MLIASPADGHDFLGRDPSAGKHLAASPFGETAQVLFEEVLQLFGGGMSLIPTISGRFKGRQFEPEVILLAVGWYLRFSKESSRATGHPHRWAWGLPAGHRATQDRRGFGGNLPASGGPLPQ